MTAYSTLYNFFAAYFHQDWSMEHDTPEGVVAYYRDSEVPEQLDQARKELDALLAEELDDAALGERIAGLGCEYDPTLDGKTWRGWVESVAHDLAQTPAQAG